MGVGVRTGGYCGQNKHDCFISNLKMDLQDGSTKVKDSSSPSITRSERQIAVF